MWGGQLWALLVAEARVTHAFDPSIAWRPKDFRLFLFVWSLKPPWNDKPRCAKQMDVRHTFRFGSKLLAEVARAQWFKAGWPPYRGHGCNNNNNNNKNNNNNNNSRTTCARLNYKTLLRKTLGSSLTKAVYKPNPCKHKSNFQRRGRVRKST